MVATLRRRGRGRRRRVEQRVLRRALETRAPACHLLLLSRIVGGVRQRDGRRSRWRRDERVRRRRLKRSFGTIACCCCCRLRTIDRRLRCAIPQCRVGRVERRSLRLLLCRRSRRCRAGPALSAMRPTKRVVARGQGGACSSSLASATTAARECSTLSASSSLFFLVFLLDPCPRCVLIANLSRM